MRFEDGSQAFGTDGMASMAWRWLRYQPDSALTRWYLNDVCARDGRSRKRGIVALARKLLIALWRCATLRIIPTGAMLSATSGD
ncbi:MAG: hypothetical protein OXC63_01075 [Aestuariivita sp.]|nr:hypothetical protein [Aestuariivita sp.]MCY4347521.1 hypothetical protein [Aestuariivita sp.]